MLSLNHMSLSKCLRHRSASRGGQPQRVNWDQVLGIASNKAKDARDARERFRRRATDSNPEPKGDFCKAWLKACKVGHTSVQKDQTVAASTTECTSFCQVKACLSGELRGKQHVKKLAPPEGALHMWAIQDAASIWRLQFVLSRTLKNVFVSFVLPSLAQSYPILPYEAMCHSHFSRSVIRLQHHLEPLAVFPSARSAKTSSPYCWLCWLC